MWRREKRGRGFRWRGWWRRPSPRRRLRPIARRQRCNRKMRRVIRALGRRPKKSGKFADAEREYKEAQALDPSSMDAVIGLANIYMRGRLFPEAEAQLRKV